jgi:hypothetical protein
MNFKHIAIATGLAISTVATFSNPAAASHYKSSGGGTYLDIQQLPSTSSSYYVRPRGDGYYWTTIGGVQWKGTFSAPMDLLHSGMSTQMYEGTFSDSNFVTGSGNQQCTGNISIMTSVSGMTRNASIKWTILGGTNCPSPIGTITTISLEEALPVGAVSTGNFSSTQANAIRSQTGSLIPWPRWQVIDSTPLNCRTSPTGSSIAASFPTGTGLDARSGNNGIVISAGNPWLRVRYSNNPSSYCFVRARDTLIKPTSRPY